MGSGEVIGNLSVHWSMDHESGQKVKLKQNESRRPKNGDDFEVSSDTKVLGRDPRAVSQFAVTLRFESKEDARTQLEAALRVAEQAKDGSSFFVNFTVPATVNGAPRPDPDAGPRPDIGIRW